MPAPLLRRYFRLAGTTGANLVPIVPDKRALVGRVVIANATQEGTHTVTVNITNVGALFGTVTLAPGDSHEQLGVVLQAGESMDVVASGGTLRCHFFGQEVDNV